LEDFKMRIKTVLYKSLNVFVVLAMMLVSVPMGGAIAEALTLDAQIALAVDYEYEPVYEWVGAIEFDGDTNTFTGRYTEAQFADEGAMNDLARYLGALHRHDGSTIIQIIYNGDTYTWYVPEGEEELKGSNWRYEEGINHVTLVSAIVADYLAAPEPKMITVSDGVNTAEVNFVLLITYTITGRVTLGEAGPPLEGVTLTYGDGVDDDEVTTNAEGDYEIIVDSGWSGTVTPSLAGYRFVLEFQEYTGIIEDQTQDYAAIALVSITGKVTVGEAGPLLEGVTLTYSDGVDTNEVTTDAVGEYVIIVDSGWSGTVTPSLAGYRFEPELQEYKEIISDQTQDYTAIALVSITGRVIVGGDYLPDVILTYSDGVNTGETKTNPQGRYTIIVDSGWSGMVTPSLAGYRFEPIEYDFTENPVEADLTAQNFDWFAIVSITGTVTEGTDGLEGVTLSYGPAAEDEVKTNDVGEYEIIVDSGWSGTVTPSKDGYRFDPTSQTYDNITVNQTQDYTPIKTYTLTVAVSPVGVGTTTPAVGTYTYDSGTSVDITATAASGYRFVNWSGGVEDSNAASTSVIMNADKTVTAEFELIPPGQYTLTVEVTPEGGGYSGP
jgi:hypothetical protein